MKKIEVGKEYKTRDGSAVRIYAIDGTGETAIHGAIFEKLGLWVPTTWCTDGSFLKDRSHDFDIVLTPLKFEGVAKVGKFGDLRIDVPMEFSWKEVKFTLEENES